MKRKQMLIDAACAIGAICVIFTMGIVVHKLTALPVVALNEKNECEWFEDSKGRVECPSELPRKYTLIHVISKERAATEVITYETKNYPY